MSITKKIMVTATMSAGKSTLINAFVGKRIMMTQNESCTAIPWEITEDLSASEPYGMYKKMQIKFKAEMATTLHNMKKSSISIFTPMYRISDNTIWKLIDTPGVNSSIDFDHKRLTEINIEKMEYDVLLYVLNGSHIGTTDDEEHLRFIQRIVPSEKIIFVINKIDQFRQGQDSIRRSVEDLKKRLIDIGFENPVIQPVSARAGFLEKCELQKNELSEEEMDELDLYKRKFNRSEFNLATKYIAAADYPLYQCGLYELEEIINRKGVMK